MIVDLSGCEEKLGYQFNDVSLLKKALTHSSCSNTHLDSNERLEFLGDSVLGLVVSNMLYVQFPEMAEGSLSRIKGTLVSRKTCCRIAKSLELDHYLLLGKGLTSAPFSLIANVMESVIGAIYLDGGYEVAEEFVESLFQTEIDVLFHQTGTEQDNLDNDEKLFPIVEHRLFNCVDEIDHNFKSQLQTKIHHSTPSILPEYLVLDEKGPPHSRCFKIAVKVGDRQFQAAWGNNKKETEQKAAENALCQIQGILPPHSDGE